MSSGGVASTRPSTSPSADMPVTPVVCTTTLGDITVIEADVYTEDSPHLSGSPGGFVLAVRNDTDAVMTDADLDYSAFVVNSRGHLKVVDPDIDGVWDYDGGVSGTIVVPPGGKVLTITAVDTVGGGTVQINGGAIIPIPALVGFTANPEGRLVAPTIEFVGTESCFVDWLI